ncbi:hypothetical protein B9Z19DRAFT_1093950 [Tuber borchii]|uniref:Beta/gamma crystallin 'Greek key' domain-containing protein n=1 Tax=Tuber borchii TaxID=42251 RepID=A0A2T6ZET6_TUBBO|nr:hypothetical protein B9Z19DRAFT_1093950 [Tuber borchii]
MQAKAFLSYLVAAILAVGVIATPVGVEGTSTTDVNAVFENVGDSASFVGAPPDPRPIEPIITPKEGDVPAPSNTSVVAGDHGSLKKRTIGCVRVTTNQNFGGTSARACNLPNGHCVNLNPFWRYRISSFSPDPYTFCKIFTGPNCSGIGSVMFGSPGYGNLGIWDNNMGSLECWY